jgi:hypothetical protein
MNSDRNPFHRFPTRAKKLMSDMASLVTVD